MNSERCYCSRNWQLRLARALYFGGWHTSPIVDNCWYFLVWQLLLFRYRRLSPHFDSGWGVSQRLCRDARIGHLGHLGHLYQTTTASVPEGWEGRLLFPLSTSSVPTLVILSDNKWSWWGWDQESTSFWNFFFFWLFLTHLVLWHLQVCFCRPLLHSTYILLTSNPIKSVLRPTNL